VNSLGPIEVGKLEGNEIIHSDGNGLGVKVQDFWKWAFSDLLNNTNRGLFAEFLVAYALGLTDNVREEWAPYDLQTENGLHIEVKSAAFVQSWAQEDYTSIRFNIRETRAWDKDTGTYQEISKRQADIYIFAIQIHKDQKSVDCLNTSQWEFYVLPTHIMNKVAGSQMTIGLTSLKKLCAPIGFAELPSILEKVGKSLGSR
jgi:hypothetical protein